MRFFRTRTGTTEFAMKKRTSGRNYEISRLRLVNQRGKGDSLNFREKSGISPAPRDILGPAVISLYEEHMASRRSRRFGCPKVIGEIMRARSRKRQNGNSDPYRGDGAWKYAVRSGARQHMMGGKFHPVEFMPVYKI